MNARVRWANRRAVDSDRGAILMLFAFMVVALMIAAAIAVDLSALERRGQDLQNAADAAALAAVTEWVDSGDAAAATAAANEIIALNGASPAADPLLVTVTFPSDIEATVALTDNNPEVFFAGFTGAFDGQLNRDATATHDICADSCLEQFIPLPGSIDSIQAKLTGDGFMPINPGNNRFYAINHNADNMVCVDRLTLDVCWPEIERDAYRTASTWTDSIFYAAVVGERIWYGGQGLNSYDLHCWELRLDTACSTDQIHPLSALPAWIDGRPSNHYRTRGGALTQIGNTIYTFTDDHLVHCYQPLDDIDCYGGGKANGMDAIMAPLEPSAGVVGAGMDRVVHDDGRIYVSLHVRDQGASAGYDVGTWVHCWDTRGGGQPCSGFTPAKIFDTSQPRFMGRLFFHREANGVITGVCATRFGDIRCLDHNSGASASGLDGVLAPLAAAMQQVRDDTVGVHTYHPPTNRVFLTTSHSYNEVVCWDFTFDQICGVSRILVDNNTEPTETYGFVYEGNCLYGLGHTAYFYSMDPDGNLGCTQEVLPVEISSCQCFDGSKIWGTLEFSTANLAVGGPFSKFDVTITHPSTGAVLLGPVSMLGNVTGELALDSLPTNLATAKMLIELEFAGNIDPGNVTIPPITLRFEDHPFLSE